MALGVENQRVADYGESWDERCAIAGDATVLNVRMNGTGMSGEGGGRVLSTLKLQLRCRCSVFEG